MSRARIMHFAMRRSFVVAVAALGLLPSVALAVADGNYDPTWVGGGRFTFAADYFNSGLSSTLNTVSTQSDGTLLMSGTVSGDWWLGETTAAGAFVLTFGASDGTGRVTSCALGTCGLGSSTAVLRQPDSKYLVLSPKDIARTTASAHAFDTGGVAGSTGFVSSGFTINNVKGSVSSIRALALRADGKILLAGLGTYSAADNISRMGVARLNADLSLDTSYNAVTDSQSVTFAGGALVRADASDEDEIAEAVLIQPGNRTVLVGVGLRSMAFDAYLLLARLNDDGSPDTTFGTGGATVATSPLANIYYGPLVAKSDRAGRIVVLMHAQDNAGHSNSGILMARFTADGHADPSFGTTGFYYDTASALGCAQLAGLDFTIDSAGRILVGGYCGDSILVERIRGDNGTLDTTFGIAGLSHGSFRADAIGDAINAITLDSGGRPLIGGVSETNTQGYSALGRLTYDLIFTNNFDPSPPGKLPGQ